MANDKKKPMDSAPRDGSNVDLYLEIDASPRSFGMADNFWVPRCWWDGSNWVHMHSGKPTGLYSGYITGWAPGGSQSTDYRETQWT